MPGAFAALWAVLGEDMAFAVVVVSAAAIPDIDRVNFFAATRARQRRDKQRHEVIGDPPAANKPRPKYIGKRHEKGQPDGLKDGASNDFYKYAGHHHYDDNSNQRQPVEFTIHRTSDAIHRVPSLRLDHLRNIFAMAPAK